VIRLLLPAQAPLEAHLIALEGAIIAQGAQIGKLSRAVEAQREVIAGAVAALQSEINASASRPNS
jgi:uncharacterized coiled-coil protein SlyX